MFGQNNELFFCSLTKMRSFILAEIIDTHLMEKCSVIFFSVNYYDMHNLSIL